MRGCLAGATRGKLMASAYRDDPTGVYAPLLTTEHVQAQLFCVRALALLEADFRALALLVLADWERLGLVDSELFAALGALQRPSWGSWSFMLQSIRTARKAQLRTGRVDVRDAIDGATTLRAVFGFLDANATAEQLEAAQPLVEYLGAKTRLKRTSDVLALPIALRNQVAHSPPVDDVGWLVIHHALRPLVEWHATHRAEMLTETREWPAPWFLDRDGETWAFNGADKDFAVSYASASASKPHPSPERAGMFVQSLQRLLGRTDLQEQTFHRLLAKLAPEDIRGVVLGDFLVGAPVARGGFASVHAGRQLSTGRKVAIKIIHDGLTEDARLRFQQEAAFLSRIAHPTIVGVISYGEDAWSVPRFVDLKDEPWFQELSRGAAIKTYIALDWIEGHTLEDLFKQIHVDRTQARPALEVMRRWFREAAEAIAAVHAAGLVHRDIKPGNLMVTSDSKICLMDFGIARSDDESRTLLTSTGYALGTPPYMSPEQIRAHDADAEVGPATDIYSLCATFYELVTGTRLFGHDRESLETVKTKKLRGDSPARVRQLVDGLPWELETILVGGLQAEVVDRYQNAEALARDLARWEHDEPITYRRPGVIRRAALAYRRNRTPVAITAIATTILVIVGVVSITRILGERDRADAERVEAETARAKAESERTRAETNLGRFLQEQGRVELLAGHPQQAASYLDQAYAIIKVADPSLGLLLADAMRELERQQLSLVGHTRAVLGATFSRDGAKILTAGVDGTARVWDATSGAQLAVIGEPVGSDVERRAVNAAAFSPDGRRIVVASEYDITVADATNGKVLTSLRGEMPVWSPDGKRVAMLSSGRPLVFDAETGATLVTCAPVPAIWLSNDDSHALQFSPDGQRLAVAADKHDVDAVVWDAASGLVLATLRHTEGPGPAAGFAMRDDGIDALHNHVPMATVAFSPDGASLLTMTFGSPAIQVWRVADGKLLAELTAPRPCAGYSSTAFSPDGSRVVAAPCSGPAVVWDVSTAQPVFELAGHSDKVTMAAFSPDGATIFTTSRDQTAKVWDATTGALRTTLVGHVGSVVSAAMSPDGTRIVTASLDHTAKVWSTQDGVRRWTVVGAEFPDLAPSADGGRFLTSMDDLIVMRDAMSGRDLAKFPGRGHTSFSPDGKFVVVDEGVGVWDAATGLRVGSFPVSLVGAALFTPDSKHLVTLDRDDSSPEDRINVWDLSTGKRTLQLAGTGESPEGTAITPDGRVLVAGRVFDTALWDLTAGTKIADVDRGQRPTVVALSGGDQQRIAIGGDKGEIAIVSITGTVIKTFDAHTGSVEVVAFGPDHQRLLSLGSDRAVRIWDTSSGALLATMDGHAAAVYDARFDPTGTLVVTAADDGTRVWDASSGALLTVLPGSAKFATFSPDGEAVLAAGPLVTRSDVHRERRSPGEIATIVKRLAPSAVARGTAQAPK